jgi:hypothetical protein
MPSPKPEHLKWLVESRKQNQEVSARLYELLTPKFPKDAMLGYEAKTLVSVGFSLWRAAFLANKSGELGETNEHATYFLGEMLETNAIAFTQDKNARGFTFNYYLANVRFRLAEYKDDHPDFEVDQRLLKRGKLKKMKPTERWRAYQKAFENAVNHFEDRLGSSS